MLAGLGLVPSLGESHSFTSHTTWGVPRVRFSEVGTCCSLQWVSQLTSWLISGDWELPATAC